MPFRGTVVTQRAPEQRQARLDSTEQHFSRF
jgi:hypothetical protein